MAITVGTWSQLPLPRSTCLRHPKSPPQNSRKRCALPQESTSSMLLLYFTIFYLHYWDWLGHFGKWWTCNMCVYIYIYTMRTFDQIISFISTCFVTSLRKWWKTWDHSATFVASGDGRLPLRWTTQHIWKNPEPHFSCLILTKIHTVKALYRS